MRQKGYGTHLVCVYVCPSVCLSGYVLQSLCRANDLEVVKGSLSVDIIEGTFEASTSRIASVSSNKYFSYRMD